MGSVPLYLQIADLLRKDIQRGLYSPGVALPSERRLMDEFGVTRATVRNALNELRSEGLVVMERGAGVFVRKMPPVRRIVGPDRFRRKDRQHGKAAYVAEMERERRQGQVELLDVSRVKASPEVAHRLGIEAGAEVVRRHRRYFADGWPLELATSYIPWAFAKGTRIVRENTGPGGIYARLEEAGHQIASFEEEITARMPVPDERSLLQIPDGVPVFRVVRRAMGEDSVVLEVCDTIMPADRYVLTYPFAAQ
jgi:GntR family transcriptional regulator